MVSDIPHYHDLKARVQGSVAAVLEPLRQSPARTTTPLFYPIEHPNVDDSILRVRNEMRRVGPHRDSIHDLQHPIHHRAFHRVITAAMSSVGFVFAAASFGQNLVVNGGAEQDYVGWDFFGPMWSTYSVPGRVGSKMFFGGRNSGSHAEQFINIPASMLPAVRRGTVRVEVWAMTGGYSSQEDWGDVIIEFIGQRTINLPRATAPQRGGLDMLLHRSDSFCPLSPSVTRIRVRMRFVRTTGSDNDGYVDDVNVRLYDTAAYATAPGQEIVANPTMAVIGGALCPWTGGSPSGGAASVATSLTQVSQAPTFSASRYFTMSAWVSGTARLDLGFMSSISGPVVSTRSSATVGGASTRMISGCVPAFTTHVTVGVVGSALSVDNVHVAMFSMSFASYSVGGNLITDPSAESVSAGCAWSSDTIRQSTGIPNRQGSWLLQGPQNGQQTISTASDSGGIDSGQRYATLTGWLGGDGGSDASGAVTALFLNSGGVTLGALYVGPVPRRERGYSTRLEYRKDVMCIVPPGTRSIRTTVTFSGSSSAYADGLNLRVLARTPGVTPAGCTGTASETLPETLSRALSDTASLLHTATNTITRTTTVSSTVSQSVSGGTFSRSSVSLSVSMSKASISAAANGGTATQGTASLSVSVSVSVTATASRSTSASTSVSATGSGTEPLVVVAEAIRVDFAVRKSDVTPPPAPAPHIGEFVDAPPSHTAFGAGGVMTLLQATAWQEFHVLIFAQTNSSVYSSSPGGNGIDDVRRWHIAEGGGAPSYAVAMLDAVVFRRALCPRFSFPCRMGSLSFDTGRHRVVVQLRIFSKRHAAIVALPPYEEPTLVNMAAANEGFIRTEFKAHTSLVVAPEDDIAASKDDAVYAARSGFLVRTCPFIVHVVGHEPDRFVIATAPPRPYRFGEDTIPNTPSFLADPVWATRRDLFTTTIRQAVPFPMARADFHVILVDKYNGTVRHSRNATGQKVALRVESRDAGILLAHSKKISHDGTVSFRVPLLPSPHLVHVLPPAISIDVSASCTNCGSTAARAAISTQAPLQIVGVVCKRQVEPSVLIVAEADRTQIAQRKYDLQNSNANGYTALSLAAAVVLPLPDALRSTSGNTTTLTQAHSRVHCAHGPPPLAAVRAMVGNESFARAVMLDVCSALCEVSIPLPSSVESNSAAVLLEQTAAPTLVTSAGYAHSPSAVKVRYAPISAVPDWRFHRTTTCSRNTTAEIVNGKEIFPPFTGAKDQGFTGAKDQGMLRMTQRGGSVALSNVKASLVDAAGRSVPSSAVATVLNTLDAASIETEVEQSLSKTTAPAALKSAVEIQMRQVYKYVGTIKAADAGAACSVDRAAAWSSAACVPFVSTDKNAVLDLPPVTLNASGLQLPSTLGSAAMAHGFRLSFTSPNVSVVEETTNARTKRMTITLRPSNLFQLFWHGNSSVDQQQHTETPHVAHNMTRSSEEWGVEARATYTNSTLLQPGTVPLASCSRGGENNGASEYYSHGSTVIVYNTTLWRRWCEPPPVPRLSVFANSSICDTELFISPPPAVELPTMTPSMTLHEGSRFAADAVGPRVDQQMPYAWCVQGDAVPSSAATVFADGCDARSPRAEASAAVLRAATLFIDHRFGYNRTTTVSLSQSRSVKPSSSVSQTQSLTAPMVPWKQSNDGRVPEVGVTAPRASFASVTATSSIALLFTALDAARRSSVHAQHLTDMKVVSIVDRQDTVLCAVRGPVLRGFEQNSSDIACARRDAGPLRSLDPARTVADDLRTSQSALTTTDGVRVLWATGHIGGVDVDTWLLENDTVTSPAHGAAINRTDLIPRVTEDAVPCMKCSFGAHDAAEPTSCVNATELQQVFSTITIAPVPWPVVTSISGCQDAYPSTGNCFMNSTLTVAGYRLGEMATAFAAEAPQPVPVDSNGTDAGVSHTAGAGPRPTSAAFLDFTVVNRTALRWFPPVAPLFGGSLAQDAPLPQSMLAPNDPVIPIPWAAPRAFACDRVRVGASSSSVSCEGLQGHTGAIAAFRSRAFNSDKTREKRINARPGSHVINHDDVTFLLRRETFESGVDPGMLSISPRAVHRWDTRPSLWIVDGAKKRRVMTAMSPFSINSPAVDTRLRGRRRDTNTTVTNSSTSELSSLLSQYNVTDNNGTTVLDTSTAAAIKAGMKEFAFDENMIPLEGTVFPRITVSFDDRIEHDEGCLWAAPNATAALDAVLAFANHTRTPTRATAAVYGSSSKTAEAAVTSVLSSSSWRICGGHGQCIPQQRRCRCFLTEADGFWATNNDTAARVAIMQGLRETLMESAGVSDVDRALLESLAVVEECTVCHPWFNGSEESTGCRTKCPSASDGAGPCTGHGQCSDGVCTACDHGWIQCPLFNGSVCGGPVRGQCLRPDGKCQCTTRFDGLACEKCAGGFCGADCTLLPFQCGGCWTASIPCSMNAYCDPVSERCLCNPYFLDPPLCQRKCPGAVDGVFYSAENATSLLCSGHGQCSTTDAKCDCTAGYALDDCSVECPGGAGNACSGHGVCHQKNATCSCSADTTDGYWSGTACNICLPGYGGAGCLNECPQSADGLLCHGHGVCLEDATCLCDRTAANGSWDGVACDQCSEGFYGEQCAGECPGGGPCGACSGHGSCDEGRAGTGACICVQNTTVGSRDGNWRGQYCDECGVGWYGRLCNERCPVTDDTLTAASPLFEKSICGGHGQCSNGTSGDGSCRCDARFTVTMNTSLCDRCAVGFAGPFCQPCGVHHASDLATTPAPISATSSDSDANFTDASNATHVFCSGHGVCGGVDGLTFANATVAPCVCADTYGGRFCELRCPHSSVETIINGSTVTATIACAGRGACNDGLCACTAAWSGNANCTDCGAGYYGPNCALCTLACSHGACDAGLNGTGMCVCDAGYGGALCDQKCPVSPGGSMCNGHGVCDQATGFCACSAGADAGFWVNQGNAAPAPTLPVAQVCSTCAATHAASIRSNCTLACPLGFGSSSSDPQPCSGRGRCADGVCYCGGGTCGRACEFASSICANGGPKAELCPSSCSKRGYCDVPAAFNATNASSPQPTCWCTQGHAGADCSFECPSQCSGRGVCSIAARRCECVFGYYGFGCESECPGGVGAPCNWRGRCTITGLCECAANFGGRACELGCACSGHGTCGFGSACSCVANYDGPECNDCAAGYFGVQCNRRCVAGQGVTNGKACDCLGGFFGDDCSLSCGRGGPELTVCSSHGTCTVRGCVCESGFYGAACDVLCSPTHCADVFAAKAKTASAQARSGHWVCELATGACSCTGSRSEGYWAGPGCDVCQEKYWGSSCALTCLCVHGICDRITGECTCDRSVETGHWAGTYCQECAPSYIGPRCARRNMPVRDSILSTRETSFNHEETDSVASARRGFETTDYPYQVTYFAVGGVLVGIHTETAKVVAFNILTDGSLFGPMSWDTKYVLLTSSPTNTSQFVGNTLQWPRISFPDYYLKEQRINFTDSIDAMTGISGEVSLDLLAPYFVAPPRGQPWVAPPAPDRRSASKLQVGQETKHQPHDDVVEEASTDGPARQRHAEPQARSDSEATSATATATTLEQSVTLTEAETASHVLDVHRFPVLRKLFVRNLAGESLHRYFLRENPLVVLMLFEPMMQLFLMPLGPELPFYLVKWVSLDGFYGGAVQVEYFSYRDHYLDLNNAPFITGGIFCGSKNSSVPSPPNVTEHRYYARRAFFSDELDPRTTYKNPFLGEFSDVPLNVSALNAVVLEHQPKTGACITALNCIARASLCVLHCGTTLIVATPTGADLLATDVRLPVNLVNADGLSNDAVRPRLGPSVTAAVYEPVTERVFIAVVLEQADRASSSVLYTVSVRTGTVTGESPRTARGQGERVMAVSVQLPRITLAVTIGPQLKLVKAAGYVIDRVSPRVLDGDLIGLGRTQITIFGQALLSVIENERQRDDDLSENTLCHFVDPAGTVIETHMISYDVANLRSSGTTPSDANDHVVCEVPSGLTSSDQCVSVTVGFGIPNRIAVSGDGVQASFVKSAVITSVTTIGPTVAGYGARAVADMTQYTVEVLGRGFATDAQGWARCGVFPMGAANDTAPLVTMEVVSISLTRVVCLLQPTRVVTPLGSVLRFAHDGVNYGGTFGTAAMAIRDTTSYHPFSIIAPTPSSLRVTTRPVYSASAKLSLVDVTAEPVDHKGNRMGPASLRAVSGSPKHLGAVTCEVFVASRPAPVTERYQNDASLRVSYVAEADGIARVPPIPLKSPVASPLYTVQCAMRAVFIGSATFTVAPGVVHNIALAPNLNPASWLVSTGAKGGTEDSGEVPLSVVVVDAAGNTVIDPTETPASVTAQWYNDEVRDAAAGTIVRVARSSVGVRSYIPGVYVFPSRIVVVGVHAVGYTVTVLAGGGGAAPNPTLGSQALLPLAFTVGTGRCKAGDEYAVPRTTKCAPCPPNGLCDGSTTVDVKTSRWRGTPSSYDIYSCKAPAPDSFDGACLGEADCDVGYKGPLCAVCDEGYGRAAGRRCGKCASRGLAWLAVAAMILFVALMVFFMTWTSIQDGVALLALKLRRDRRAAKKSQAAKTAEEEDESGVVAAREKEEEQGGTKVLVLAVKLLISHLQLLSAVALIGGPRVSGDDSLSVLQRLEAMGATPMRLDFSILACAVAPTQYERLIGVCASAACVAIVAALCRGALSGVIVLLAGGDLTAARGWIRANRAQNDDDGHHHHHQHQAQGSLFTVVYGLLLKMYRRELAGEHDPATPTSALPISARRKTKGRSSSAVLDSLFRSDSIADVVITDDAENQHAESAPPPEGQVETEHTEACVEEEAQEQELFKPRTPPGPASASTTETQPTAAAHTQAHDNLELVDVDHQDLDLPDGQWHPPAPHDGDLDAFLDDVDFTVDIDDDLGGVASVVIHDDGQDDAQGVGQDNEVHARSSGRPTQGRRTVRMRATPDDAKTVVAWAPLSADLPQNASVVLSPKSRPQPKSQFLEHLPPPRSSKAATRLPRVYDGDESVILSESAPQLQSQPRNAASSPLQQSTIFGSPVMDPQGLSMLSDTAPRTAAAPLRSADGVSSEITRAALSDSEEEETAVRDVDRRAARVSFAGHKYQPSTADSGGNCGGDDDGAGTRMGRKATWLVPLAVKNLTARRKTISSSPSPHLSPNNVDGCFVAPAPDLVLRATKDEYRSGKVTATAGLGLGAILQFSAVACSVAVFLVFPQALQLAGASFRCETIEYGLDRRRSVLAVDFAVPCNDRGTLNAAVITLGIFGLGAPLLVVASVALYSRFILVPDPLSGLPLVLITWLRRVIAGRRATDGKDRSAEFTDISPTVRRRSSAAVSAVLASEEARGFGRSRSIVVARSLSAPEHHTPMNATSPMAALTAVTSTGSDTDTAAVSGAFEPRPFEHPPRSSATPPESGPAPHHDTAYMARGGRSLPMPSTSVDAHDDDTRTLAQRLAVLSPTNVLRLREVGHERAAALFYYFTGAYRPERWWWEGVSQSLRAAVWIAAVALPDPVNRAYTVVWLLWAAFLLVVIGRPFKIALLSKMELVSLTTVLVAANAALLSVPVNSDGAATLAGRSAKSEATAASSPYYRSTGTDGPGRGFDQQGAVYTTLPLIVTLIAHFGSILLLFGCVAYVALPLIPKHYVVFFTEWWTVRKTDALERKAQAGRRVLHRIRPHRVAEFANDHLLFLHHSRLRRLHAITADAVVGLEVSHLSRRPTSLLDDLDFVCNQRGSHGALGGSITEQADVVKLGEAAQSRDAPAEVDGGSSAEAVQHRLLQALAASQATLLTLHARRRKSSGHCTEDVVMAAALQECFARETALIRGFFIEEN